MKKTVLISFALMLSITAWAHTAAYESSDRYVPNEIIVKFRGPAANTIEEQTQSENPVPLIEKYKVKELKPLFKDFRKKQQKLNSLQKKDKGLLTQKEKHILSKLKRAPAGVKAPGLDKIYKIKLDLESGQSLEQVLEAYRNNPDVEYAELNHIVAIDSVPNDPLYAEQLSLTKINAPQAWDIYTGSRQTVVAVVDTGVDYNHRDLRNNIWLNEAELNGTAGVDDDENGYVDDIYGYNFIYRRGDALDDHGHGTHCAGIIATEGNNGLDIAGVCWDARIMSLKFMGSLGTGSESDAAEAFYYAVANGADVISNSWSSDVESRLLEDAINYASSRGVIVVAAAGNSGSDSPRYPAAYPNVISVAATDANDDLWSQSSYGEWVDIAAPGVDVLSLRAEGTWTGTSYDEYTTYLSGTSAACPYVAGACALMLSANPFLTAGQVSNTLTRTADAIEEGICRSNGRINLSGAMNAVVPSQGYINLDRDFYTSTCEVGLLLADRDLAGTENHEVTIETEGGDSESVCLYEIEPAFGVFAGTISIAEGRPIIDNNVLELSSGEVITATYSDTDSQAISTDSAVTDFTEPQVFDVQVETIARHAIVTFNTDEPTTARIRYGTADAEPYTFAEEDLLFAKTHTIKLQPLTLDTDYYFVIELADAAGNQTTTDSNDPAYSFATSAESFGLHVPGVYSTIQAAIDDASDGDTIWVADGQYSGDGNIDIDFKAKAITVISENGPENCIIDCDYRGRGFDFHSGEDQNSVLDGFTIINGYAGELGGGIRCTASSPTITNCIITENTAAEFGGGICNSYYSSPTIINCTFVKNSAEQALSSLGSGGGMCNLVHSNPTIINCKFSKNSANYAGAGIYNDENSNPILTKCTFFKNTSPQGGGICNAYDSNPVLTKCIFNGNVAEFGGAIKNVEAGVTLTNCTLSRNTADRSGGIWNSLGSASVLSNCILWNNADSEGTGQSAQIDDTQSQGGSIVNYCCIQGWTGNIDGIGNIANDPLFVEPNSGDFHLKSAAWRWDSESQNWSYDLITSPCVDAGNPGASLGDELSTMPDDFANALGTNLRINMGAYGGTTEASMSPYNWTILADLTNDGIVNMKDFAAHIKYTSATESERPGDLNRDGKVDTSDLTLLAGDWLKFIKPPGVKILKPRRNDTFTTLPVEIAIIAEAWDINGSVVKVEFFVNEIKIGRDIDGSDGWTINWTSSESGSYNITAKVTDNGGLTTTSSPVEITIILQ